MRDLVLDYLVPLNQVQLGPLNPLELASRPDRLVVESVEYETEEESKKVERGRKKKKEKHDNYKYCKYK
jgi:hypothetical protein